MSAPVVEPQQTLIVEGDSWIARAHVADPISAESQAAVEALCAAAADLLDDTPAARQS